MIEIIGGKNRRRRSRHVIRRALFRLQWRLFAFFQPDTTWSRLWPPCPSLLPPSPLPFFSSRSSSYIYVPPFLHVSTCATSILDSFFLYAQGGRCATTLDTQLNLPPAQRHAKNTVALPFGYSLLPFLPCQIEFDRTHKRNRNFYKNCKKEASFCKRAIKFVTQRKIRSYRSNRLASTRSHLIARLVIHSRYNGQR